METKTHVKARTEWPESYPPRAFVPATHTAWESELPDYSPTHFTHAKVLENDVTVKEDGWADPPNLAQALALPGRSLVSYEGPVKLGKVENAAVRQQSGAGELPLNPRGRTGIEGRGLLGKWGANFAADPLVTRLNPGTGQLELLVIQRKDSGQWALPGGMVDPGEDVTATLTREFEEEAGAKLDLSDARLVYQGYVDDPRNTDNAWMETTVKHKHLDGALAQVEFRAGDDASDVKWLPVTASALTRLYASHGDFVRKALGDFVGEAPLAPATRKQLQDALR